MSAAVSSSPIYVEAVSCAASGLPDWQHAQAVLRGEQAYAAGELTPYQPNLLPANERRRASPTVRMAFRVAEAVAQMSSVAAADLAAVFASSDGDLAIASRICTALAEAQRLVSPTDFHNSVHNAAAGYWSIATHAQGPSTAIAAGDHSFAVGLMEALSLVRVEQMATLLVAYDVPAPVPLHAKRSVQHAVGVALILTPHPTANTLAALSIKSIDAQTPVTPMQDATMEALRIGNPAARALPLLQLLAYRRSGSIALALPNNNGVAIQLDME